MSSSLARRIGTGMKKIEESYLPDLPIV